MLVAAPAYLAQRGTPATPSDLTGHACLRFRFPTSGKLQEWVLQPGTVLPAPSTLVCNNMEAMREACIAGLGIAYMPDFLARDALRSGALSPVLAQYGDLGGQFWMLWPASHQLSPKLRAFVDFMAPRLLVD